jgi:hypothetical protein
MYFSNDLSFLEYLIYQPFNLWRLLQALFISLGIWVDIKLLWMLIYEVKYGNNMGEIYFLYGKKEVEKRLSSGNKP